MSSDIRVGHYGLAAGVTAPMPAYDPFDCVMSLNGGSENDCEAIALIVALSIVGEPDGGIELQAPTRSWPPARVGSSRRGTA